VLRGNDNSIYTISHASPLLPAPNLDTFTDANLLSLARLSGFVCRSLRKLDLRGFLLSCMILALQQTCSLRNQAILAGISASKTISKQALHKRLAAGKALLFLQGCLAAAIASKLTSTSAACRPACFERILVQDSTCLSLSPPLADLFPGPSNQCANQQACLRIQCLYDLCKERFISFALSPFTRNDQASACDLLPLLKARDMVLRDLGYFTLSSLKAIAAKAAFFLTRLRYGVALYSPKSNQVIDLSKMLLPGATLDIELLLGMNEKLPVRLMAFPLPASVANERRRKARVNRDKRLSHSEAYMHLLGWNIFLTNASKDQLPLPIAAKLYRLRWRVEILFKSWKSHLGLKHVSKLGRRQVEALLYGLLLFAVLMHNNIPLALALSDAHGPTGRPPLSLLRIAQLSAAWLLTLLFAQLHPTDLQQRIRAQIHVHCRYDSRRRYNYVNLCSQILS